MHAEIQLSPANADYARRIELVGSLKKMARKCSIIELAIAADLERRRNRGQSPCPQRRAMAVIRDI
jgi:hypothetical protein